MEGQNSHSGIERPITERQRLSHRTNGRCSTRDSLDNHGKGWFNRDYLAVCGFVVAVTSTNVYDAFSIAQGRKYQALYSGVWSANPRIAAADVLVELVTGTRSHGGNNPALFLG